MREFDVVEQTDVADEEAYERGLTVKAVASVATVVLLVLVRQRYLG
jgi:hypothetical protein